MHMFMSTVIWSMEILLSLYGSTLWLSVCVGRPSLKELCLEDKRRVRQLIEELARVSSEKEMAEERLRGERKAFQELLLQLRSEHQEVVKEKQGILCTTQGAVAMLC